MRIILSLVFLGLLSSSTILAQGFEQTVRGEILDIDNNLPIIGAEVVLIGSDPLMGTITDSYGRFKLENVAIGRINLGVSYLGYEELMINNLVVNSAKEVILNLKMTQSIIKMDELVITANKNQGEAINEMAMLSARSISAEETSRYAGGLNDPARITNNFAGVTNTQDGSNDIIVRGNAPKYMQWRLEGVQITNPNHFGDQSAVGGAISVLNNNILSTSDFYTGAFAPEFGDVLSGVYDVKLRAGNNEKFEAQFALGLLGTDLTVEGPFSKSYGGSYLINYRYSTISIPLELGLFDIKGVPKFQDAAFKVVLPSKNFGQFSFFGLGGKSGFSFEEVKPAIWVTPGENGMIPGITETFKKEAYLVNLGMNHTLSLSENSFLRTTINYGNEAIGDDIFEIRDSMVENQKLNYQSDIEKRSYRAAMTYNHRLNAKHKIQIGSKYGLIALKNQQSQLKADGLTRFNFTDFDEDITTIRNFFSWKYRITEDLTMVTGLHNMNVLLNDKQTWEPRLAFKWQFLASTSFNMGYGLHSTMEGVHSYFAQVEQADGSVLTPNEDLGLLKARHYVTGIEHRFNKNMRFKVEAYYQDLYDLPVENIDTSYYATINEGLEFRFVDLVNEGTGKNYGLELTLERFFSNNYYYLINASLFQSKYTPLDGIERNSQYNNNYLFNILIGKEFDKLGKNDNQTFSINVKIFYSGGKKIIPLLRDDNGDLAVDPSSNQFYDYTQAYEDKIEDLHQVTISMKYKWNKKNTTHELFLDLDNITNNMGKSAEFYDESEEGNIGYVTQFGLFPNLMYRLYF